MLWKVRHERFWRRIHGALWKVASWDLGGDGNADDIGGGGIASEANFHVTNNTNVCQQQHGVTWRCQCWHKCMRAILFVMDYITDGEFWLREAYVPGF